WKMQHQTGQREINELHVPVGQAVKLTLTSEDVIHDLFVPDFRVKLDVLPGRYMQTWFQATKVGSYDLYCSQYCGTNHAGMIGKVVVMEKAQFDAWLDSHAEGSLALQGRKVFLKYQCITCHSADSQARAPVLEGLFNRVIPLEDGKTAVANEDYIRESILKPRAKVVAGWRPIMPSFEGQVDEQELIQLIAFVKALRPGETPARNEESTPPAVDPTTGEAVRPNP
ncbi:MAG: c-type cytochrome, partial [Gemmataceae bacterium]